MPAPSIGASGDATVIPATATRSPVMTTSPATTQMVRATSRCSGVWRSPARRDRAMSWFAVVSAPTRVATYRAVPASTDVPARTVSPRDLAIASASPVRKGFVELDARVVHELAVHHDLVTAAGDDEVAEHDLLESTARSWPSRTTDAPGRVRIAIRSRARLARDSWTTPTTMLKTTGPAVRSASTYSPYPTRTAEISRSGPLMPG